MTNQKSTFNPKQVRQTFKSYVCGEFMLPSGKQSGEYKFPISDEEINYYMQYHQDDEKPKCFLTWSEWALWTSLRLKYGFNYLKPPRQQFLSHINSFYIPQIEENNLEEKMLFYIDNKLSEIQATSIPLQDTEKNEKNFRASLDNYENDVLY